MAAPPPHSSKNLSASSCSPLQSRPRSSEVGNSMRRSFSGNPFAKPSIIANQRGGFHPNTPANSPSDYPRRHSVGRENIVVSLRDQEDKENSREQNCKPSKVRSPASSKGTKHFMSPTISAASKVNASPRKKVLAERNEPIRTSMSSFEGKGSLMDDCDPKPDKGLCQKKEVSFDTTVTYLGDSEAVEVDHEDFDPKAAGSSTESYSDMLSGATNLEKDCVNLDPSFEVSPRVSCSVPISALAPLDADPSMPPYDPKTNYLSPRPQFLHYKPNPRIELYINQDREGKQLEESFTSESNSDTDVTEEESQSENSQKETEDGSSIDVAEEEKAGVEEENELPVTEVTSISIVEVKKVSKRPFFARTKFTVFLLLVATACLCASLSNSPIMEANVLNNLSFSEPYIPPEIAQFTRNTFNDITLKLRRSLYNSLSCIHDLFSSFRERHKIGPLQYANLTNLLDDSLVDNRNNVFGLIRQDEVDINEPVEEHEHMVARGENSYLEFEEDDCQDYFAASEDQFVQEVSEDEAIQEDFTTDSDQTVQPDDNIDEVAQEENSVQEAVEAHDLQTSDDSKISEPEELNTGSLATLIKPDDSVEVVTQRKFETFASIDDAKDQNVPAPQTADVQDRQNDINDDAMDQNVPAPQAADVQDSQNDINAAQNDANAEETSQSLDNALENPELSESTEPALDDFSDISAESSTAKISMLILSLLAVTAFLLIRYQRHPTKNAVLSADQMPQTNKNGCSPVPIASDAKRPVSQNWLTEVDADRESCPSEMSSYKNSSAYTKNGLTGTSEAQSHETRRRKNYRRESLASSDYSTGSPSYGSFTTYEKIPMKHGYGDEEVITPVRRSSRIRNIVTSP